MERLLRPFSKSMLVAAMLLTGVLGAPALPLKTLASPATSSPAPNPAPNPAEASSPTETALGVEQATAAANNVLDAVKRRDANARYRQFSDELKAVTSPSMVQRTMNSQPKVLSWKILSISRGSSNTTAEVAVTSSAGTRDVFIVFNNQAKIIGYHIDRADVMASKVASQFVSTLADGQYISARGFLSLQLQKDISAAALQRKWQELQQLTGNFVRVKKAVEATSNSTGQLVLVLTEFNRLTDTLFVVMDPHNQIVGVDFPIDPLRTQPMP